MSLAVRLRRRAYRAAYVLLRVYWFLLRPSHEGVKCVLSNRDRVLLVRHTYGPDEWELPGGSLRRGEDPARAATREMHEELGLRIETWLALGEIRGRMNHRRDVLYCFGAELTDPPLTPDPVEIAGFAWFARTELPPDLGGYTRFILAHTRPVRP
jgi:8-oxo-dGTP pyrophosphatase MutT (NUDIX family)